ncbi:unnamed protein product [Sphagnum balticum]
MKDDAIRQPYLATAPDSYIRDESHAQVYRAPMMPQQTECVSTGTSRRGSDARLSNLNLHYSEPNHMHKESSFESAIPDVATILTEVLAVLEPPSPKPTGKS